MTISDYLDLFAEKGDQLIRVYDLANGDAKIIYEGYGDEIPWEIECLEICSFDNIYLLDWDGYIGINVSTED